MEYRAAVSATLLLALFALVGFWWVDVLGDFRDGPTLTVAQTESGRVGKEVVYRVQNVSSSPVQRQDFFISCPGPPCFREFDPGEWVVREAGPLFLNREDTSAAQVLLRATLAPGEVARAVVRPDETANGTLFLRAASDAGVVPVLVRRRSPVGIALEYYVPITTIAAIGAILSLVFFVLPFVGQKRINRTSSDGSPPSSDSQVKSDDATQPDAPEASSLKPDRAEPVTHYDSPALPEPPAVQQEPPHHAEPDTKTDGSSCSPSSPCAPAGRRR